MRQWLFMGLAVAFLAGCGGPVPEDAPVQGLAAAQAGLDAEGVPLADDAGPQDTEQAQSPAPVQAPIQERAEPEPKPRTGLFGLFRAAPDTPPPPLPSQVEAGDGTEPVAADPADVPPAAYDQPLTDAMPAAPASAAADPAPTPVAAPRRAGLFALFGGGRADAAATPTPLGAANAAPAAPNAPGAPEVSRGTVLPFGAVATACGLSKRDMGKAVDQTPRDGRARWQLYDTDPSSTGQRTQFISGFRDRCARQVTGALVLFGNPDVHETTRYAKTNKRAYTQTDEAYEKVKSRICGVRPRVPCPADRLDRLNAAVSFVTVYSRFGATDEWYELLLVDGQLEAASMSGF